MWDENGLVPAPSAETTRGEWVEWEFDPPDGDELTVFYDARIEPAAQSGRSGEVAVLEDGVPVVVRRVPHEGAAVVEIIVRATVIFAVLFLLTRGMKRRTLADLAPFELLLLVTLGDIVQQGITQEDYSLTGVVLATSTFAFWITVLSYITWRSRRVGADRRRRPPRHRPGRPADRAHARRRAAAARRGARGGAPAGHRQPRHGSHSPCSSRPGGSPSSSAMTSDVTTVRAPPARRPAPRAPAARRQPSTRAMPASSMRRRALVEHEPADDHGGHRQQGEQDGETAHGDAPQDVLVDAVGDGVGEHADEQARAEQARRRPHVAAARRAERRQRDGADGQADAEAGDAGTLPGDTRADDDVGRPAGGRGASR